MKKQKVIGLLALCVLIAVGIVSLGTTAFHVRPFRTTSFHIQPSKPVVQDNSQSLTAIAGHVVDAEGKPVVGARVSAVRVGFLPGPLPGDETNERGEFKIIISSSKPGTYKLYVSKEDEGYAQTITSFYCDKSNTEPEVIVNAHQVTQDVTIGLGQKLGILVGRVIDAATKKPIKNALITIRRADSPDQWVSGSVNDKRPKGAERFIIPVPCVPFTIEVEAPGYETWVYSDDGTGKHASAAQVLRGEKKELTIALKPISNAPAKP